MSLAKLAVILVVLAGVCMQSQQARADCVLRGGAFNGTSYDYEVYMRPTDSCKFRYTSAEVNGQSGGHESTGDPDKDKLKQQCGKLTTPSEEWGWDYVANGFPPRCTEILSFGFTLADGSRRMMNFNMVVTVDPFPSP
jgi:hypothetical protein